MQTCVAALRLPGRMSVERVAGCWWTGWPDGVECAAMDDGVEACCRVSDTWEGFKSNYPTLESLIDQVMGEQVFEHLQVSYTVQGLDIEVDGNHGMCELKGISVVGAEFLYGPNAALAA